jgi:formylglycine-generating enzyme required for sulfatase activity
MSSARSSLAESLHPLAAGIPPLWADAWGQDAHGGWCAISVGDVVQRLRWIPPGEFRMGSPEDEEGRWDDEGPQHGETMAAGFWMFETPCTQALWQEVMGTNPSHFQGPGRPDAPQRPVETVSWEDCQQFLARLNGRLEGLILGLPSEAQWEYACRAGTTGPRYGDLDAIAWWGENSGGETHPVATKLPNRWGLYDMLGNVWEWCADPWSRGDRSRPAWGASAHRVVRGGSWYYDARSVRAACRPRYDPSSRYRILGFRCAEFQEGS